MINEMGEKKITVVGEKSDLNEQNLGQEVQLQT